MYLHVELSKFTLLIECPWVVEAGKYRQHRSQSPETKTKSMTTVKINRAINSSFFWEWVVGVLYTCTYKLFARNSNAILYLIHVHVYVIKTAYNVLTCSGSSQMSVVASWLLYGFLQISYGLKLELYLRFDCRRDPQPPLGQSSRDS